MPRGILPFSKFSPPGWEKRYMINTEHHQATRSSAGSNLDTPPRYKVTKLARPFGIAEKQN